MTRTGRLEELLATLFRYGSWLASATIGLGFALALVDSRLGTMRIATMGIVLFILLPVLGVLLMLLVFVREGNVRLAITAGFVLAVILFGAVLGFRARLLTLPPNQPGRAGKSVGAIWTANSLKTRIHRGMWWFPR
jgi:hypothetical protein